MNSHHPPSAADAIDASRVGTTLGKYRLLGVAGQGGMGVVYEGEDTVLQRRVAIKLLPDRMTADAQVRDRFLNEARAAARLNHPHAVTIYEIGRVGSTYYIAMELARGGSMQQRLKAQGPLPWPEATRVVADACRGLAAAHAAGLVHRDIKPANIMRSETGLVKLSDFGLAHVVGQSASASTVAGSGAGTPHFMSPEQCRNDPLDQRSDLYSLGATYYALLTGRPPYQAGNPIEVMFAHCSREIPDPRQLVPELPEACAAIVARATAKYPAHRYQSASEMLAALEQALPGSPPMPPVQGNTQAADRESRPQPSRVAMLGLAAAVGIGVLIAATAWLAGGGRAVEEKPAAAAPSPEPLSASPARPAVATPEPAGSWRAAIPRDGLTLSMGGQVEAVAFSPDGKWLAAGCLDGEGGVRIWDMDRLQPHAELWPGRRFHAMAFSPDSQMLVVGGQPFEGRALRLWSVRKGGQQAVATENAVRCVAFEGAGRLLAAGLEPASSEPPVSAKLWRLTPRRELPQREQFNVEDSPGAITTVLFCRDGKTFLSAGNNPEVHVRDVGSGAVRQKLATGVAVAGAALAPDGRTLAVVGSSELQFWNVAKGVREDVRRTVGQLQCVAWRRDGKLLATGSQSGLVTLWNATTHEETQNLRGHTAPVWGSAFSPDGRLLATASGDRTVRLWDVGAHKP